MSDTNQTRGLQLRSLVTTEQTVEVSLTEVEVTAPGPDEVVVRVEASAINPSDLGGLFAGADLSRAEASGTPERPVITAPLPDGAARAAAGRIGESMPVGNEGAGTVVAAGSSAAAQRLLGKVVAGVGGAMYAQYRCLHASAWIELPEGAEAVRGAASFVNPMTALGMVATMRAEGHTALVHTAAASSLGQMLNRLCLEEQVPLVNIVRSPAQVELLRAAGATHVCDTSSETFADDLGDALRETGATLAFDAIGGGPLAGQILSAMETALNAGAAFNRYGSSVVKQVYIYGGLDRGVTVLDRSYGMAWGVGGWLLAPFLAKAGPDVFAQMRRRVAEGLSTTFASHFTDELTLPDALSLDAVQRYGRPTTGRKFVITPHA